MADAIAKQFAEVTKALGRLVAYYPHEILRGGIKNAVQVEKYFLTAQSLGVPQADAQSLLDETRRESREWGFGDATAEAKRRLMETYAALMPWPSAESRKTALRALLTDSAYFDLTDVDQLARQIEASPEGAPDA